MMLGVLSQMDASQILKIIADDLTANPNFTNSHGVDLNRCAVAPSKLKPPDPCNRADASGRWARPE